MTRGLFALLQAEAAAGSKAELPHQCPGQSHGHFSRGPSLCQDVGTEQAAQLPALHHHHRVCHDCQGAV